MQRSTLLVDAPVATVTETGKFAREAQNQRQHGGEVVGSGKAAHPFTLEGEQPLHADEPAAVPGDAAIAEELAVRRVRRRAAQNEVMARTTARGKDVHDVAEGLTPFEQSPVPHPMLRVAARRRTELRARLTEQLTGSAGMTLRGLVARQTVNRYDASCSQ